MYTCTICLSLNHNARLHCQNCGTVPAKYSFFRKPISFSEDGLYFREAIAAKGCDRTERHHTSRCNLKTVALDYYAEA